jgi:GT2 family glycosyltransferase
MAVLAITPTFDGVEEAIALFEDSLGESLGQQAVLVNKGRLRPSVLHVPAQTEHLLVALTVSEVEPASQLDARLTYPGRLLGMVRLAVFVYRVNRQRGVSLPRFLLEKTVQLHRLGLRNLFRSPSSHVQLREFTSPDYLNWQRHSMENLLANGSIARSEQVMRLAVFIEAEGIDKGLDSALRASLAALAELGNAQVQAYVFAAGLPATDWLGESTMGVDIELLQTLDLPAAVGAAARDYEWCCYIKAGDIIRPHALHVLGEYANTHAQLCICYSDHDYLQDEERHSPWFKPRWSPEYFRNFDFIGRAVFYRGEWLAKQTRLETEITRIHTSLILAAGMAEPERIHRIPDVLFSFPGRPARQPPLERQAVISEHLTAAGIRHSWQAGVEGISASFVDYSPGFESAVPRVSIIVPTRDQLRLLKSCVESVLSVTRYPDYEIIVVDNGSRKRRTLAYLEKFSSRPECRVLHFDGPFNFSAINNFAVQQATGELICLLNNDIEVLREDWLSRMAAYFALPDVGTVGAKLLYRDRRVQHAGVICGLGNVAGHAHRFAKSSEGGYMNRLQIPGEFSAVTGACLLTRRTVWDALGGMNAQELAVAYNDVDYCLKLGRAGYRVIYVPQAELFHLESRSRGSEDTEEKKVRYKGETEYMWSKWESELRDDACYNPNLSRVREDFSLGLPARLLTGQEILMSGDL